MLTIDEPLEAKIFSDIAVSDYLTVCISENGTLEVIFPWTIDLTFYTLFDGANGTEDTEIEWSNKTQIRDFAIIKSESGCFTVFNSGDNIELNIILFRWKKAQIINCNNDALFVLPSYGGVSPTPEVSASIDGPCKCVIIASPAELPCIVFSFIRPFPNEYCKFQSPLSKSTWFPAYNANDALIYSPAIIIEIPANSTIDFWAQNVWIWQSLDFTGDIPTAEMSPGFNGMKQVNYSQPLIQMHSVNVSIMSINFYLKTISGEERLIIYSDMDRANYTFTSVDSGKNVSIAGSSMIIYNYEVNPLNDYFFIEYTASTNMLPTTFPTTLSTTTPESTTDSSSNPTSVEPFTINEMTSTSYDKSTFKFNIYSTTSFNGGSPKMSTKNIMILSIYFILNYRFQ